MCRNHEIHERLTHRSGPIVTSRCLPGRSDRKACNLFPFVVYFPSLSFRFRSASSVWEEDDQRHKPRKKKQLIWYLKVWFNLASYLGFAMKWKNFTHQVCATFFHIWVFIILDCKIVIILNLQNKIPAECTIFFSTKQENGSSELYCLRYRFKTRPQFLNRPNKHKTS